MTEFGTGYSDLAPTRPKYATFSSSDTAFRVIDDDAKVRFRVLAATFTNSDAGTVSFHGGSGPALFALVLKADDPATVLGYNPDGWFETGQGESLEVQNPDAATLNGTVTYIEI